MKLHEYLVNLFDLFFPNLCLACENDHLQGDALLCLSCELELPKTNMHQVKENHFTDRFFGKVPLQAGAALYYFKQESPVQHLVHNLKYKGKPKIGVKLGEHYGKILSKSTFFSDIDLIIPVPLHPIKERQRGYNQSDQFAMGLSKTMNKPWIKNGITRVKHGKSQTQKDKSERFEVIIDTFEVKDIKKLEGKHILLVDDVLTTGATLEACATKILAVPNTKISMATIAIAMST